MKSVGEPLIETDIGGSAKIAFAISSSKNISLSICSHSMFVSTKMCEAGTGGVILIADIAIAIIPSAFLRVSFAILTFGTG